MTTQTEALKLALEALENSVDLVVEDAYNAEQLYGKYPTRQGKVNGLKVLADQHKAAITAIKEALAQPEQEPVAWMLECWGPDCGPYFEIYRDDEMGWRNKKEWIPLYTTPPQRTWVYLTNQEHEEIAIEWGCLSADWVFYAAAVERKVKEKNT